MKVVDTNILIYATDLASPLHAEAREWWKKSLNEPEPIGLPWVVSLSCIRMLTSPKISQAPMTLPAAIDLVEQWLDSPNVTPLTPQPGHLNRVRSLLHHSRVTQRGRSDLLINDIHIAALALETGGTVYSCDKGFAQFKEVRYINPIRSSSK